MQERFLCQVVGNRLSSPGKATQKSAQLRLVKPYKLVERRCITFRSAFYGQLVISHSVAGAQ